LKKKELEQKYESEKMQLEKEIADLEENIEMLERGELSNVSDLK